MKDRISSNPGRRKITPEGGTAYYATVEMADNPTQVGTPLTKANLLSDATATLLGLTGDPTVNDALAAIRPIAAGGTGASTASGARSNLGLAAQTYTTLEQIGLSTGSETIAGIYGALPQGAMLLLRVINTNADIYPTQYGVLLAYKGDGTYMGMLFINASATSGTGGTVWGASAFSSSVWSNWHELLSTSSTLGVSNGGTGRTSVTTGNYLVGAGTSGMTEKTPSQVRSDIGAAASSHTHGASDINSGTLGVARGGTGLSSVTSGNFVVGNGTGAMSQRTPSQVRSDIGAAASSHTHSASDITGTLGLSHGGTGGTTKSTAQAGIGIHVVSSRPSNPISGDIYIVGTAGSGTAAQIYIG